MNLDRICTECGSVFVGGRGDPLTCDDTCARARRNRLRREARRDARLARLATARQLRLPVRGERTHREGATCWECSCPDCALQRGLPTEAGDELHNIDEVGRALVWGDE